MAIFSLFRTEKPTPFEYKPRYYDVEKDSLERKRIEMGLSAQQTRAEQLRARMQFEWNKRKERQKRRRNNTIRLFVYITLVILMLWWIMN